MHINYRERKTLDPANQFAFKCPVFLANTKIASCFALYDLWMRGEPPAARKGCQVAMHACKCPLNIILKDMVRLDADPYHSVEAKVGSLKPEILERIAPVLVQEKYIEAAGMSAPEAARLMKCNEEARGGRKAVVKQATPDRFAAKPVAATDAITEAAKSGDMASAVSAEIKETT